MRLLKPHILFLCLTALFLAQWPLTAFGQQGAWQEIPRGSENYGELYESRQFSVNGESSIRVFNISGDITVTADPEAEAITVELYVNYGFSLFPRNRNLDNYRIIMAQRGNEIVASTEGRRNESGVGRSNTQFRYVIRTPEEVSVNLRTINGQIAVSGLKGRQNLSSTSGNLFVRDSEGIFGLQTVSGSIWAQNSSGTIRAASDSGDLNFRNMTGDTRVRVVSGDIRVDSHSGFLAPESVSGDIRVSVTDAYDGISVESVSGNIEITIPDGGYEIDAAGLNLQLQINGGFSGTTSGNSARGIVGDGAIPVKVRSLSGQVSITRR